VRDAYYAGVAYGVIDVERLLYSLAMEKGDVVVSEGGLEAVESLLINRNMMYQTVYRHHAKRIAESMAAHAVAVMVEGGVEPSSLFRLDDIGLVGLMRDSEGYVGDIMRRIDGRRLFKKVFGERLALLSPESVRELGENAPEVQERIRSDLGIDEGYLLLDYPEASMSEYRVSVKTSEGLKSIAELSQLANALEKSERDKLTVNVYARDEDGKMLGGFRPQDYFSYVQQRISGYV
jgi:uncharacterized protein